jgi:hypothetical protein
VRISSAQGGGERRRERNIGTWRHRRHNNIYNNNSVALVCERIIPTERPPLVGEVSVNVCR